MIIENKTFDNERALYGSHDIVLKNCAFDGPADGESALKECSDIDAQNILFNLRYPCWHVHGLNISSSEMTDKCRAALWYSDHIRIQNSKLHGIKALRECRNVEITGSDIISPEFGWSVTNIRMEKSKAQSEYFMMRSEHIEFKEVEFSGKYSFQYIKDAVFDNCRFDTKDAFWHAEHVLVRDSLVKGEYLAWYSKNVTFENCTIIGTQPLCYCENLRLINCRMLETDLSFEKSEVEADITTEVLSIKNPSSGIIRVPAVKEIIRDDPKAKARIEVAGKVVD
ncbi:DUF3737 family protein [Succinatimonas hippei]|uniref:DUF3737 family protein n=1 Tax=Succinatimonas hippei TaxID=626938 RepID=UPI0025A32304|nr:DUF3737 family protein [Succinatimonas hippei]MDM8121046.1 DUF3737 family protein [Succinatimonas hippei]